ncbi:MAG: KdsC family phosphatase, partial [Chloroflexota bacterium]
MRKVRLLALDSDGVLTDGGVYILEDGGEFRRFDIHDGAGLKAVMQAGVRVAVISSGRSPVVQHRCKQLGIPDVYVGVDDKLDCLNAVCAKY